MTPSATTVTLTDDTTNTTASQSGPADTATNGIIAAGPVYSATNALLGVPDFSILGPLTFSNCLVDGAPLGSAGALAPSDRVSSTNLVQIKTSAINTTGNSFDLTYENS